MDEGKDSEKPLSDAQLIQAVQDSDDTQGAKDDLWLAIKADMVDITSQKRVNKKYVGCSGIRPQGRFAPRMRLCFLIFFRRSRKTLPAELTLLPVIGTALIPVLFRPPAQ